jgi:hypothetical protein
MNSKRLINKATGLLILFTVACSTAKVPVSNEFSSKSTRLHVKGLNGWQVNQELSFGNYLTSKIKRGWDFSSSLQYTKFSMRPDEAILRVFDISTDKYSAKEKRNLQYSLFEGNLATDVYATEKFNEKQLKYKSNNPWIGEASKTTRYEYAFTAAIVPLGMRQKETWSLVLINRYDAKKDTARKLFDRPYVEEEGYATNGTDNIAIRPLRLDKVNTSSGKQQKLLAPVLSGYELTRNQEVIALIDLLDNSLVISNSLEREDKLIVASIGTAMMLRKDKKELED